MAVNMVGIFVHNLMENAQRRAFLDTRNCIEARIQMDEENQKLERLLLSVLPKHVAIEMKNDMIIKIRQLVTLSPSMSLSLVVGEHEGNCVKFNKLNLNFTP